MVERVVKEWKREWGKSGERMVKEWWKEW